MEDNAEFDAQTKIEAKLIDGKLHVIFPHPTRLAGVLRKVGIHKFTRNLNERDRDLLDDVMDCDPDLLSLSLANEGIVTGSKEPMFGVQPPFYGTGYIETDTHFYNIIFESLKRKVQNGPSREPYPNGTNHRRFIKSFFAPFLITDEQADEIVEKLNMSKVCLYGRLR